MLWGANHKSAFNSPLHALLNSSINYFFNTHFSSLFPKISFPLKEYLLINKNLVLMQGVHAKTCVAAPFFVKNSAKRNLGKLEWATAKNAKCQPTAARCFVRWMANLTANELSFSYFHFPLYLGLSEIRLRWIKIDN